VKEKGAGRLVCSDHKVVYETVRIRERGISRQRTFYMCETILKDGELTYDELYKIAGMAHRESRSVYSGPADLLVAPSKAWADGKVTKTHVCRECLRCSVPKAHRDPGSGLLE
jgi:hypothetical protein